MSGDIKAGDIVRVKDTDSLLVEFARKVNNRDGVVEWVGKDEPFGFNGRAKVRFLKRNGRGKEFSEIMRISNLIAVSTQSQGIPE